MFDTPYTAPNASGEASGFHERVERYLDGTLDEAGLDALRADLHGSPESVDVLVSVAMMRGWLTEHLASRNALPAKSRVRESGLGDASNRARKPKGLIVRHPAPVLSPRVRRRPAWAAHVWARAAVAAILMGVAGGTARVIWRQQASNAEYITGAGDTWSEGRRFTVGDSLPRGPLALERGSAWIRVRRRAVLLVEGPARFELASRDHVILTQGKVVVRTAPGQRLAVWTPTARVTDVGTEFGVGVSHDATTFVHVFEGVVEAVSSSNATLTGKMTLQATEGAVVRSGKVTPASVGGAFRRAMPIGGQRAEDLPPEGVVAWWRFEEAVPPPPQEWYDLNGQFTQHDVIEDSAGRTNCLSWWPGAGPRVLGAYQRGNEGPPPWMFRPGADGGQGCFDARGAAPDATGIIFHDTSRHGRDLCFDGSFTIEAFFKVMPDAGKNAPMTIVFRDIYAPYDAPSCRSYLLSVNERADGVLHPGAVQFSVFGRSGETGTVAIANANVTDGSWHYAAARYDRDTRTVSLLLLDETGHVHRQTQPLPSGFVLRQGGSHNLHVAGRRHLAPVWGRFIGLLDEVRLSSGVLKDTQLLAAIGDAATESTPQVTRPPDARRRPPPSLRDFRRDYPLAPVRSYTFLGTENSTHELWKTTQRYSKPVVEPNGTIAGWFDPSAHVSWLKSAMASGAYDFGLVDGYLPAVHYIYRRAGTDSTCEMTAFAVDAEEPGSIFIHVALIEKDGDDTVSAQYFKLGGSEDSSQAEFDAALQALRARWAAFFAAGARMPIPDPDVLNACKASIVRALITFTGKRPHYGVQSYGPGTAYGPDFGDGFPPTIISLVDCLLDWGQAPLAREYFAAYVNDFIRDDGRARYYCNDGIDGCSVAEYGQFLWLARKCMDAGGSREWFEPLRPKLERICQNAWAAASAHPDGLIPGCGEADLRRQVGIYFHNNGWMWRGLRDIAPLFAHPGELDRCEALRRTVQAAIARAENRSVTPMFIPPMPAKTPFNNMGPFATMTEDNFVSYTNYRYWPELLSSGILTTEQAEAIIAYRETHGGEIAGMTRIWKHADNWPIAEYAAGLRDLGRLDGVRRVLYSHLAGHVTPETWTAYEQVAIQGHPYRGIKANYCVPAQLVAPRLAAWLWPPASSKQKGYTLRVQQSAPIRIDGRLDEPIWASVHADADFSMPWEQAEAPATMFRAWRDDRFFYFAFDASDTTPVVAETCSNELAIASEDRVELYFAPDWTLSRYYCLEIDPAGRVLDYAARHYRQFDYAWTFPGQVDVASTRTAEGYAVEGRLALTTLESLGIRFLQNESAAHVGLFRADLRRGAHGQAEEHWISWVDPNTVDPDFHVTTAFGMMKQGEQR